MDDREDRIRARAHSIWEREGRPHGRHEEHWRDALRELEEGPATYDAPSSRSLGSAAQSDLLPPDAGGGSGRAGSLVDTGPALGLVAGSPGAGGTGGGSAGLGNLSPNQGAPGEDAAGGMASIGEDADEAGMVGRGGAGQRGGAGSAPRKG